ncbi:Hypothetical predicted protein [Mytilus galloprovincialis]|uniref:B box-type domain-containing protein n=1 Tax=Mytilus galloprovincialis TaxID=29158 RepID=A0A8B6EKN0_MYTGA|nr:Hypothetical predicted protein [Mytilus galloprovincialis]
MAANYCEPCTARGRTPTALEWCTECEEALCSECSEAHKVQKMSRSHHLVDIDKIPKTINRSYNCSEHEHLPFDYFCVDHDVICCKECLPKNHLACTSVTSIDIASNNFKQSQSFLDSEEQLRFILEALEKLINNRKENCSRIEQEEKIILEQIASVKQNVISRLESLERSLKQQLTEMKEKYITKIQQQEKEIADLVTSCKSEKEGLEFVRDHGSEKQTFVSIHSSKPILDDIENKVKQLSESFADIHLKFVKNVSKENITNIGSTELMETPCSYPFVPYKQRQSQVPVVPKRQVKSFTHLYDIDMKGEKLEGVTGITISDNNTLVFCDSYTKNIYFCDENDTYQSSTSSLYKPWVITTIPGTNTGVMSNKEEPCVQLLDIERRRILKQVKFKQCAGGIAATNENIFVSFKGKIQVLDIRGNLIRTISLKHKQNIIAYISICPNGNICYSTVYEVHCITSAGCPVFSYASSDLLTPRNTTTDDEGCIYILDWGSHTIHKLTSTGTLVDILLKDCLARPMVLCFNRNVSKVYVANQYGKTISVFKTNFTD